MMTHPTELDPENEENLFGLTTLQEVARRDTTMPYAEQFVCMLGDDDDNDGDSDENGSDDDNNDGDDDNDDNDDDGDDD